MTTPGKLRNNTRNEILWDVLYDEDFLLCGEAGEVMWKPARISL